MGIEAILFNGTEPFEQIGNSLSTEGPMWNLVKIAQAVSEMTFKNYTILYINIAKGQGQKTSRRPWSQKSGTRAGIELSEINQSLWYK